MTKRKTISAPSRLNTRYYNIDSARNHGTPRQSEETTNLKLTSQKNSGIGQLEYPNCGTRKRQTNLKYIFQQTGEANNGTYGKLKNPF